MSRNLRLAVVALLAGICGYWMLQEPSAHALASQLQATYQEKLANTAYQAWKSAPGLPKGYQEFPEEQRIKELRSELSRRQQSPPGATVLSIARLDVAPQIDGRLRDDVWADATPLQLGEHTTLRLLSDGECLYLGCDVPEDQTELGYDQFRFYIHPDLCSAIVNERIHLGRGRDDRLGGIRQTNVTWSGAPATKDHERWKKHAISDWRIYREARGRSTLQPHRQYEVSLDLAEMGLHLEVPFAAFVEVESDPVKDENGKFVRRTYLGELGSQGDPVWFVIPATD
ncbi:MAG: hypothetical protein AAF581_02970 [Planctomycetota bacterium]